MDNFYWWVSRIKFNITDYTYDKCDGLKSNSKLGVSLSLKLKYSC
jgi:hypothetical protein